MNEAIKFIGCTCLLFCALFVWVMIMILGFFLAFTSWAWLYMFIPFIGIASALCIIKCAIHVLVYSNPEVYFRSKYESFSRFFKEV